MIDYLIAGLGNPGERYDNTRHNMGFLVADELMRKHGVKFKKVKFHSVCANWDNVLLIKPQTFMNLSGQAVRDAARFYQLPPERVIVIHDDIALPPGRLRLRPSGSDGGHNGIKDILYHLQSDAFPRVKVGVGNPPHHDIFLNDWVLSQIGTGDRKILNEAIVRAADAVECILSDGIETAMNRFNRAAE